MLKLVDHLALEDNINLYFEGQNFKVEELKTKDPSPSRFLKKCPNLVYNDDPTELLPMDYEFDVLTRVKHYEEIEDFNRSLLKRNLKRERNMLYDSELGLLKNYKEKPKEIHIQIVGTDHAKYGIFEKELSNVPHVILISNHEAQETTIQRDKNYFSQEPLDNWTRIIHELGYIGKNTQIYDNINAKFGPGNWLRAHIFDSKVLSYDDALKLYEKSYLRFFKTHPDELEWLTETASEVYDNSLTNIESGLDYNIQETESTHLQDIAIRRALKALGKEFNGNHPFEIRGYQSEGYCLNPGQVKFIDSEKIIDSGKETWWKNRLNRTFLAR